MKRANIYLLGIILVVILSASSCNKKEKDNKFKSYIPVQSGNTWVYQVTGTNEFQFPTIDTSTVIITVLKDTLIDNASQSYVIEENKSGYKTNFIWQLKDGQLLKTGKHWIDEKILFQENTFQGDQWILDREYGNGTNFDDTTNVAEAFEKYSFGNITAPAFKLNLGWSQYGPSRTEYINEEIYMPYIGLIKATYEYDIYGKHSETWTLTDYYTN